MQSRTLIPSWLSRACSTFWNWTGLVDEYRGKIEVIVGGVVILSGGVVAVLRAFGVVNFLAFVVGIVAIVAGALVALIGLRSRAAEPGCAPSARTPLRTPTSAPPAAMPPWRGDSALAAQIEENSAIRRRATRMQLANIERDADQAYWRDQILSRGYDVYSDVEGHADFEIERARDG